jgi:hypothetical protein
MFNWAAYPPLEPGRVLFMASDRSLHSVPVECLWEAYDVDPDLTVLADSPEGWQEFVGEQIEIEQQWNLRKEFTVADQAMFASMGIAAWNDPSLEDFVCAVLDSHFF